MCKLDDKVFNLPCYNINLLKLNFNSTETFYFLVELEWTYYKWKLLCYKDVQVLFINQIITILVIIIFIKKGWSIFKIKYCV